jgi:hypothetical protein
MFSTAAVNVVNAKKMKIALATTLTKAPAIRLHHLNHQETSRQSPPHFDVTAGGETV